MTTNTGPTGACIPWPSDEDAKFLLWFWWDVIDGATTLVGFEMHSADLSNSLDAPRRIQTQREAVERYGVTPRRLRATDVKKVAIDSEQDRARELAVGAMERRLKTALVEGEDGKGDDLLALLAFLQERVRKLAPDYKAPVDREPRPSRLGREHYEEVAAVYLAASDADKSVAKAVAAHFTEKWGEKVSPGTAAKWNHVARNEHGLLPPTKQGRPRGGTPATTTKDKP